MTLAPATKRWSELSNQNPVERPNSRRKWRPSPEPITKRRKNKRTKRQLWHAKRRDGAAYRSCRPLTSSPTEPWRSLPLPYRFEPESESTGGKEELWHSFSQSYSLLFFIRFYVYSGFLFPMKPEASL